MKAKSTKKFLRSYNANPHANTSKEKRLQISNMSKVYGDLKTIDIGNGYAEIIIQKK